MQLEQLEALLEHEKAEGQAREQRHRLTVERLRRQITSLQVHTHPSDGKYAPFA